MFIGTVAAVEFFHTRHKGHLHRSHAALDGMATTVPIKHTAAMMRNAASLWALHFSARGYARLEVALLYSRGEVCGWVGACRDNLTFSDE